MKHKICPDCLSKYKRSKAGKLARKTTGAWGKGKWPSFIYHSASTRKCEQHHAEALANSAARRAGLKQASPAWVDRKVIKDIYIESQRLSQETGIKHHVDHIIPLRGKTVSGLNVPWNLKPIPAKDNIKKSNHFTG